MGRESSTLLRPVLLVFGLVFIFGVWPLMTFWPSGWQWQPAQPEYEQMILGVYATLGAFLVWASRSPGEHRSLILFAGWSSLVHSAIMALQALGDPGERGHFLGDIPVLAVVGIALLLLAPKRGILTAAETRSPEPPSSAEPIQSAETTPRTGGF